MKVDTFTKIVLVVIAINLTILTFKNFDIVPRAYANGTIENYGLPLNINYGLVPLNEDGSINVKFNSDAVMDVNITNIDTSDKLKVVLEEVDSYAFSYCTVPVEIQ